MAQHKLWNIKEENLRNISNIFFVHAMEVIGNQNSFTNSLQNTFFYVPQKK